VRIAHLSDPHFSFFTSHPNQFLSKRWIGNFNFQLFRKRTYQTEQLWHLPDLLSQLKVDVVLITGDFSSTSLDEEFEVGKKFIEAFYYKGLPIHFLPGNHDCYTRAVERCKRFYDFFPSPALREKKVECISLLPGWWYIGLDCTLATPPFCAYGYFKKETEQFLVEALAQIPRNDRVILANHFPLFPTGHPLHDLKRVEVLQKIMQESTQTVLYLHGHDHHPYIIDRQEEGFPLTLNSGSCANLLHSTFFIFELFEHECLVQQLLYSDATWNIHWQQHYSLTSRKKHDSFI
jgi:3',5'-cyclic AMP phosphodiesterase CpdA